MPTSARAWAGVSTKTAGANTAQSPAALRSGRRMGASMAAAATDRPQPLAAARPMMDKDKNNNKQKIMAIVKENTSETDQEKAAEATEQMDSNEIF